MILGKSIKHNISSKLVDFGNMNSVPKSMFYVLLGELQKLVEDSLCASLYTVLWVNVGINARINELR